MRDWRLVIFLFIVTGFWCAPSARAQTTRTPTTPGAQEPCWKQLGISQQALQQHRQIAEQMHNEVEQVCSNSSLSAQQKQQKIKQIREQAHAQMDKLISASQMAALKECRAKRGQPETSTSKGSSPCGELPAKNNHNGAHSGPVRN
jgi:hypothetical protein